MYLITSIKPLSSTVKMNQNTNKDYERTMMDMNQWSNKMIGKIYYQTNPKDENSYRTIRLSWNPFANKIIPQYSNFVVGTPPDGMPQMNPRLISSLATFQNNAHGVFY